jgi:CRISPR-associated protein Csm3
LKTENIVDRKTGAAEHPRTGERVLPGSKFDGEILLHVYGGDKDEDSIGLIRKGLRVIEEFSAMGAGGSRGSGRVKFLQIEEEKLDLATV